MIKKFLLAISLLFLICKAVVAESITVFEFTKEELVTLKVKKVKGKTTWSLGSNKNGNFIKAESEGKGSGLGKEVLIDLSKTPFIIITW